MHINRSFLTGAILFLPLVAVLCAGPTFAVVLDLTTAGASGYIGAAWFKQVENQPTGTGVIDPFLRVQANGSEQGVNSPGPYLMDEKSGIWTHAIHLSDFGAVTNPDNGVASIRVLLDIDETANAPLLSMDRLRIYTATVGTYNSLSQLDASGSLIYDLDAGSDNVVYLNYLLDNGSGSGDMLAYLPVSLFAGHDTEWFYLYSQFGATGGDYVSDNGFEEWTRVDAPPVPEPAPLLLFGGGLLGWLGIRTARRNRV
jgi:hypothetical protein